MNQEGWFSKLIMHKEKLIDAIKESKQYENNGKT